MTGWINLREGCIALWHRFLDYDTRRSSQERVAIQRRRERAKEKRLARDEENRSHRETMRRVRKEMNEASWRRWNERQSVQMRSRPQCIYCGGLMTPAYRNPQSGIGCLILIVGLVLAPILVGIPIIVAGLMFMGKTEKYMKCRDCGCGG